MTLKELEAEFRGRSYDSEMLLLAGPDAIALIDRAIGFGFRLLGVEGFRITDGGAIQPEQEQSNDVAESNMADAQFIDATRQLIQSGMKLGFRYEVVLDAPARH